jgi:hypothetical protein
LLLTRDSSDRNGVLDEKELLELVRYLIEFNLAMSSDVGLSNVTKLAVSMLCKVGWDHFLSLDEDDENIEQCARFRDAFIEHLKHTSSTRKKEEVQVEAERIDRDDKLDILIKKGKMMENKGVFAIPKLIWSKGQESPSEERRVLERLGFLLDSCP